MAELAGQQKRPLAERQQKKQQAEFGRQLMAAGCRQRQLSKLVEEQNKWVEGQSRLVGMGQTGMGRFGQLEIQQLHHLFRILQINK